MGWLLPTILSAISAFAATNLDDILILMFFFAQVHPPAHTPQDTVMNPSKHSRWQIRHIILGQYLGFLVLLLLSLPGFLGGLIIPRPWIGLLGLVPIAIGLKQVIQGAEDENEGQPIIPQAVSPTIPQSITQPRKKYGFLSPFSSFLAPQTYSMAVITLANGGDNIGIYVPFFASLSWRQLCVVLTVFLALVAVWCAIAYGLTRHPRIGKLIPRQGHKVVPWVLISLGLWILWESKSYQLLKFFY